AMQPIVDGSRAEQTTLLFRPTEEVLAGLWSEVLGIEGIGVDGNFFELGGHSLMAARLIAKVRRHFDVDITLREFFESPTITGFAEVIDRHRRERSESPIQPINRVTRARDIPASPAQEALFKLDQGLSRAFFNIQVALRLSGTLDSKVL